MSIPTVAVTCTAYDQNGNAVAGGTFRARLNSTEIYNGFVVPEQVVGVADATGVCVLQLWPNALGVAGSAYRITAVNPDTGQKYLDTTAVVPNSACNLHQIIVAAPYPTVDASEQALIAAQAALAPVTAQAAAAAASATNAASSATAAATSATAAAGSASTATTQAGIATTQAGTATTQAGIATTQAGTAATQASTATTQAGVATTQAGIATTKASEAAASASTATTQAGIATTQAGVATTKASEAATSATNAANSAYTAGLSIDAAVAAKDQAISSASAAASSATAAAGSATAAATSASGASSSASTATTQAGTATTQAGLATTAATTATSKASEASTYASNASASANTSTTQAGIATTQAGIATTQAGVATSQANIAIANANAALSVYGSVAAQQASVTAAQNAATSATASAAAANTSAGSASGFAANALAIYGTTAAQQAALINAQAAASLAQGYAASAASVAQQDLSGVTSAALHRSPNAVTAMFLYDTSKDSDGGAWTEKCQHTSWFNEAVTGKWLGPCASEAIARNTNGTLGSETVTNGTFTAWTLDNPDGFTVLNENTDNYVTQSTAGGACRFVSNNTANIALRSNASYTVGAAYQVSFDVVSAASGQIQTIDGQVIGSGQVGRFNYIWIASQTYFQFSRVASCDVTIDNLSIKQVTALTTSSNDYFQLTTDGKFYRLWKNLLKYNRDPTNAAWTKTNFTITTGITDPLGGTTAVQLTATAASATIYQSFLTSLTSVAISSIWVRRVTGTGGVTLYSPDGTTSLAITGTLDGTWRRFSCTPTSRNANGAFYGAEIVMATSGDVIEIAFAQLELGTVATTEEAKTTDGSTTEVFRGNKRKFPKLAGIVAESPNQSAGNAIVIYDLTEPGRPMWMRFVQGSTGTLIPFNGNLSAVSASNGVMAFTQAANFGGLTLVNFASDTARRYRNSNQGFYGSNNGVWQAGISKRNIVAAYDGSVVGTLVNETVNAVAMTVLPDAPVDPVTGLKVPTIWVGTQGGLSVIKQDGTVTNNTIETQVVSLSFITPKLVFASTAASNWRFTYYRFDGASATIAGQSGPFAFSFLPQITGINGTGKTASANKLSLSVTNSTNDVRTAVNNVSNPLKSIAAYIKNTFNTGHMVGDIRRTYLADVDVGSVSGVELAANVNQFVAGMLPAYLVINSATSFSYTQTDSNWKSLYWAIPTSVQGRPLLLSFNLSGSNTGLYIGTAPGNWNVIFASGATGVFKLLVPAIAGITSLAVQFQASSVVDVTNWSVKEFVADRSYKAQAANITGTLTKSQVASAAQLVAYSGFSASNYLREPYSTDLDFGTGEWTVGAWVNVPLNPQLYQNLFPNSNVFTSGWQQDGLVVTPDFETAGGLAYTRLQQPASSTSGNRIWIGSQTTVLGLLVNSSIYVRKIAGSSDKLFLSFIGSWGPTFINSTSYDPVTQTVSGPHASAFTVTVIDANTARISVIAVKAANSTSAYWNVSVANPSGTFFGGSTGGVAVAGFQMTVGSALLPYEATGSSVTLRVHPVAERAHSSGARIAIGYDGAGFLTATAFDGTTTRTVTTTAAYNTATWLKAEADYTTDGSLSISVNGVEVAVTRGNPLLTLNNSSAVLTIGNSFAADAPFPGSIALLKASATVPTAEQMVWMYEQEKQMFRDGAQVTLPDSGSIVDLTYDDLTDKWLTVSATNESEFSGLVRTNVTASPAGSYSKITATSGVQLQARTTTNPGVDITIPAGNLREELLKDAEAANKLNAQLAVFDYVGGFTATTVTGNTAITSVASLTYPVSYIGARVSGSGIPADTFVAAISGTTVYLTKAATASASAVAISFTDFILPTGMEAKVVSLDGVAQREGATGQFTRLFDGFKETIRFGTAPSNTARIQIQAARSAA
jgi:hypothetical protein